MKRKKRPGFVQHSSEFAEENYRILRWWKKKRGGSINEFLAQMVNRRAKEIVDEIGAPPDDFK